MEMYLLTGRYLRAVWHYNPRLTSVSAVLMLLRTVGDAASLVLIIPLLVLLGVGGDAGSATSELPVWLTQLVRDMNLNQVLLVFLVLVVAGAAIGFVQQLAAMQLQTGFLRHIRVRAYNTVMSAEWPYLALQDASRINHTLSLYAEQSAFGISAFARIVSAILLAGVSVVVALFIQPWLTLIVLGLSCLIAVPVLLFDMKLYRLAGQNIAELEDMFSSFGRELDDLKAAKVASGSGIEAEQFARLADRYCNTSRSRNRLTAFIGLFHEVAGACVLIGLVYIATSQATVLAVAPIAVAVIFIRLFPALQGLQSSFRDLFHVLPAWKRLSQLVSEADQHHDGASAGSASSPDFARSLQLRGVSYAYPGLQSSVLKGVDLSIRHGTATVIVGLSGAGKTTLLDLVSGLLEPDEGVIEIDGKPLHDGNRAAWCSSVAYVVQDAQLSNGTVRQNVGRFMRGTVDDGRLWEALRLAGADDIVRQLPDGLDQQLGDRGQRLSRGQRQRLALARGLVTRPKLLILDEATSALNPQDEELVVANLKQLLPDTTLLIVAHKLASLGWADSFYELEDGFLRQLPAGDPKRPTRPRRIGGTAAV